MFLFKIRNNADINPALSAPDLQCIIMGYSTSLNNSFAANIVSALGVSREVTGKLINLILYLSQVSFSR
tara:strand:+ start:250 stop:456 length:207 start_codon:yes stop_codon:yes gene_type:complete